MENKICIVVLMSAFYLFNAFAQSGADDQIKDANSIFTSIMQSLPKESRDKIDSAGTVQRKGEHLTDKTNPSGSDLSGTALQENQQRLKDAVSELPEDIRVQVMQTIEELKKQENTHMLEFKEMGGKQR